MAMRLLGILAIAAATLAFCPPLFAADLPGSKDPDGFKRFEGSEIIHYATNAYAPYILARSEGTVGEPGFEKSETVEGQLTRIVYRVPMGHSALEVFRNYERALEADGFTRTFELASGKIAYNDYFADKLFFQSEMAARRPHEDDPLRDAQTEYYMTAQATKNGQTLTVAVMAVDNKGLSWRKSIDAKTIEIKPGQAVVSLDIVAAKAIEDKMVVVKAADIADALSAKGSIALYGIYFDIDKSDVNPDSDKTLDEIASLLKIDRSLKLEIAGHTDNTGSAEHNMTLSQARAQAVVDTLVKKYGIDSARLQAKGYGDTKPIAANTDETGRSKNRRVELKKL
jgi:OmpA-OmpF porin, OOP family